MRAFERLVVVLLSAGVGTLAAWSQVKVDDLRNFPIVTGTATEDGLYTVYHIKFSNRTNVPMTRIRIRSAGTSFHFRTFQPFYSLPTIAPGRSHTFNVWVRGKVSPPVDPGDIGVVGEIRQGNQTIYLSFPDPCSRHRG